MEASALWPAASLTISTNILAAINGYTELALEDLAENDHPPKTAGGVEGHQAGQDLIKQILTFSRFEADQFRPIRIQTIIRRVLRLLRSTLPTTIELGSAWRKLR